MDTKIYRCYILWQMLCLMFFGMCHALADVTSKLMADVIAMLCVVDVITTRQMV